MKRNWNGYAEIFKHAKLIASSVILKGILIICGFALTLSLQAQDTLLNKKETKLQQTIQRLLENKAVEKWKQSFSNNQTIQPLQHPDIVPSDQAEGLKGRIIRNIFIQTYDPILLEQPDSTLNWLSYLTKKLPNQLHHQTNERVIERQLLFESCQPFDPLLIQESERLLRQNSYLREAFILLLKDEETRDSIDIIVMVHDRLTMDAALAIGPGSMKLKVGERNFLGLSHHLQQAINFRGAGNRVYLSGSYSIPVLNKKYVSFLGYYGSDSYRSYQGFLIQRTLFSPLTPWAYGFSAYNEKLNLSFNPTTELQQKVPIYRFTLDGWLVKSVKADKRKGDLARSTRVLWSLRGIHNIYRDIPEVPLVQQTLLGGLGYSIRRYYKESNIYRFGVIEDIPRGIKATLVSGVQKLTNYNQLYIGSELAWGERLPRIGYLYVGIHAGRYFHTRNWRKGIANFQFSYFSKSIDVSRWMLRQFIYGRISYSTQVTELESLTLNGLNDYYKLPNQDIQRGTQRILINTESVFYSPWRIGGFKFSGLLFAGWGWLGNAPEQLFESQIVQVYGLGVMIRNENILAQTLRFSIGFYPNGTDNGLLVKFNPLNAYNLRLKDFDFLKPELVPFQ